MSVLPHTLVDALRATAVRHGNDRGVRYYATPTSSDFIGYADIDRNARSIAVSLTAAGHEIGETALIAVSPGLGWAPAVYGVMYAGLGFVPAPIAGYGSADSIAEKAAGIGRAAEAALFVTDRQALAKLGGSLPGFEGSTVFVEDLLAAGDADAWARPDIDEDSLAYLLFTSGSTGDPKGVIAAHGGITASCFGNRPFYGDVDGNSTVVGWAPLHHITGLSISLLIPATIGVDTVITPTEQFQRRPILWLQLISKHKGTVSASGNFAFALCTQLVTEEQVADLDLSSLRALICGSEPILPSTMWAFMEKFAPAGLAPDVIAPSMGQTESGLISAKFAGEPLVIRRFDAKALESGELVPVDADGDGTVEWVSCGRVADDVTMKIVDPETREVLPDGRVGEIWVSSYMVSPGYFHRPEATAETFGLSLPGDDLPYLRTGDLAAILDGQLYVTGRLKEMIIIRGRNLYPQDIEAAARSVSPAVGIGSAFELTGHPSAVGLVFEVDEEALTTSEESLESLVLRVKESLMSKFSLPSLATATLPPNHLPRTAGGKVRRSPTRIALEAGDLAVTSSSGFRTPGKR